MSLLTGNHGRDTRFVQEEELEKRREEETVVASRGVAVLPEDAEALKAKGEFVRGTSGFRNWVGADPDFPVEAGRYVLVVANNCPWCHRVLLARGVLGLEEAVGVDTVFYRRDQEKGWQFMPDDSELRDHELAVKDTLLSTVGERDRTFGKRYVPEIYQLFGSAEKSVPLLIDTKQKRIVSNESADIVRMFGTAFKGFGNDVDLYPQGRRAEIEEWNDYIYSDCNNAAYKAGFTSNQESYDKAYESYFTCLEKINDVLSTRRFLVGNDTPTEADLRLFPTVYRHDPVYFVRMKLSKCMIRDLPHLHRWLNDMLSIGGIKRSSLLSHSVNGYFGRTGNQLVPKDREGDDAVWY